MTISGSGFGPKGPRRSADTAPVSTRASERRKAAQQTKVAEGPADAFEVGSAQNRALGQISGVASAAEPVADLQELMGGAADRASQLTNILAAFEENTQRLDAKFAGLKQQAEGVVQDLVRGGFAAEQLHNARPALDELRNQMAKVRSRIHWNTRRMKTLRSGAHSVPPFEVGTLQRKASRASRGDGFTRGLQLIAMGGDIYPDKLATGQGITRLQLGGGSGVDRHAMGQYVSQVAPGAMLSRFAVGLIEAGRQLAVRAPISAELDELHDDVKRGRAGKNLEALALLADAGK